MSGSSANGTMPRSVPATSKPPCSMQLKDMLAHTLHPIAKRCQEQLPQSSNHGALVSVALPSPAPCGRCRRTCGRPGSFGTRPTRA